MISLKVMSTLEIIETKSIQVLSEKCQEIAQSQRSYRQVLMSGYRFQLVRWKQEQASVNIIIFEHEGMKESTSHSLFVDAIYLASLRETD